MVVDDDAANRELLEEFLVAEGLEVVTAPDGRSSLEAFARLAPDLVLLDVNMPFVDGFEVYRRLKINPDTRLTPGIPQFFKSFARCQPVPVRWLPAQTARA